MKLTRRAIIPIQPMVAWYVGGRKMFGREPISIRRSWKVGKYGRAALADGDRSPPISKEGG